MDAGRYGGGTVERPKGTCLSAAVCERAMRVGRSYPVSEPRAELLMKRSHDACCGRGALCLESKSWAVSDVVIASSREVAKNSDGDISFRVMTLRGRRS